MTEAPRLEDLPLFENLTREELAELKKLMEPASFEGGDTIFEEDGPEDYFYVLTSGTVEVHKEVLSGERQHLATMEAPTIVGEMGLLTGSRAAATVEAKTPVSGQALPREPLLEKLEAGDVAACKVAYQIGRILARRMNETNEAVAEIIGHLEKTNPDRDLEIFQDKLMQEWAF